MGWCCSKIGDYSMCTHDSIYDTVRNPHSKSFFEKLKVEVELSKSLKNGKYEKEIIMMPLTMLGSMKQINKFYEFELDIYLSPILFDELKNRGILLSGHGELNHYCGDDNEGKPHWVTYYLNSPIGDENIKLSTVPNVYSLTSHEDFLWMLRNGMEFKQTQELKWKE